MCEMWYNTGVNHIKSSGALERRRYPFSTCDRGARTMSHSIPDLSKSQNISAREEWRPVVDWEHLYEVSNFGRVRSLPRYVASKLRNHNGGFWRKGAVLRAAPDSHGHLIVVLCDDAYRRTMPVHLLVASAFLGPRPEGFDTHHKNENKGDNRASNLEYMKKGEHTSLHSVGKKPASTKLKVGQVRLIREMLALGTLSNPQIGSIFGVSAGTISAIKTRRTWRNIDG